MKISQNENKVILAVDPFVNRPQNLLVAKQSLQTWRKQGSIRVLPVSLVSSKDLQMSNAMIAPWGERLQQLTEGTVKPFLKSLHLKNMAEPRVIMSSSKSHSLKDFVEFAKKQQAQMIVTTTHDKYSSDKNRIGKFTQKLIELSEIPVLTVRPTTQIPGKFSRILFPTDFSKQSRKAFKKALIFANNLKAKIVIYHNIYEPVLPAAEFTGVAVGQYEVLASYSDELHRMEKTNAEKWILLAKKAGVKAEYQGQRADFSLSKSILKAALAEKVHMIVLGIESHRLLRTILKSSVREVVSSSNCPVLVINSGVGETLKN